ncbi:MAG: hypothetical protein [Bacteriophage sp.]|nr:MAG: hypothetical protein [Bacteriophage sp.]
MSITVVIKISHTAEGMVAEHQIQPGDTHCPHEMMLASSIAGGTADAVKEINEVVNKLKQKFGGKKNVH